MTGDDKKIKTDPAPTKEAAPKEAAPKEAAPKEAAPKEAAPKEAAPQDKSAPGADSTKVAGDETASSPSGYSRGEGQKPVSKAYKDNWNVIFAKKTKKKKR